MSQRQGWSDDIFVAFHVFFNVCDTRLALEGMLISASVCVDGGHLGL